MRRLISGGLVVCALAVLVGGCHREAPEAAPLFESKISIADKFYDVQALSPTRAVVVGYGGKALLTEDGGQTWTLGATGTDRALYSVDFVDDKQGWVSGQDGLILHTTDGGRTWAPQVSGTTVYLFAVDFVDAQEGWVVGDRATYLHTTDGGRTWTLAKFGAGKELSPEERLLAQEPVLYDVQFVDREHGWVVGEFGKIYHTADGGRTWAEQEEALLGKKGIFSPLDLPTFFGVHFADAENGIAAGLEGRIVRTRDGGATWDFEAFDVAVPLVDPLFEPFQFKDTTGWAVGAAGEVVRQAQAAEPWRRADMGMEIRTWLRGVDFFDHDHGWIVGGYGTILYTTDGGKSWLRAFG